MTLDEMQNVWSEMTEKLENQKQLTDTLIMEMTAQKFRSKIGKISTFESAGAVICFIAAIFLAVNFEKLDTWYLSASGVVVIGYLIFVPFLVLRSIYKMKGINISGNTYKQSLIDFAKRRKHFLLLQRTAIILNFVLLVLILPVSSKIFKDKDLFVDNADLWYWYIPVMLLFLIPFSKWGYTSYKNMTASAEELIRDLQTDPS
jgi:hypothetical protein